jgi:dTDP-4-amino-4,6-dideoxygalactose transaminase
MTVSFLDIAQMHAELRTDLDAVWRTTVDSSRFIGGPEVEAFEAAWSNYCQTNYCVGLSSGTAALQLVLTALGIGPGDEVIVPANTFIASAAAVVASGAQPVFVDVDPATLLLGADTVRAAITPRTAAVMPVHLYGQPTNMDAIGAVAEAAGLAVIEDAAQAHGATWNGKVAGSMGIAGCFSFYPGKNLGACGDAGAVVTNDWALAEAIRALSNHGRRHDDPYQHTLIGGNHRLDALQAGILRVKLRYLDAWNASRRQAAALYAAQLANLPVMWVGCDPRALSSHHLAVIQTDARERLRQTLTVAGIGVGIHYPIPCHQQVPFASQPTPSLPIVERAAQRILSLPMHPHVTAADIEEVVGVIRQTLGDSVSPQRQFRFEATA